MSQDGGSTLPADGEAADTGGTGLTDFHLIETAADIGDAEALQAALAARGEILALSQAACEAVLAPDFPGGLSHAERAALACRMAQLNGEPALAGYYAARIGAGELAGLADPGAAPPGDPRLAALLRHVDRVTVDPKAATPDDIKALKAAGIDDADIVRLSELIAFLGYQARVVAGLRLMRRQ